MGVVILIAAVVVISVMSSTAEQRAAARERMKPIGRILLIPTLALLAAIILTWPKDR